ncbi:hypothetical protein niasHT_000047 [Heterodera trifolii]|uniref:Uncharacterized protein n=1 Tax=Heterodera trifolii TaxID=157864 RepID=A0ABD2MCN9_9BILA
MQWPRLVLRLVTFAQFKLKQRHFAGLMVLYYDTTEELVIGRAIRQKMFAKCPNESAYCAGVGIRRAVVRLQNFDSERNILEEDFCEQCSTRRNSCKSLIMTRHSSFGENPANVMPTFHHSNATTAEYQPPKKQQSKLMEWERFSNQANSPLDLYGFDQAADRDNNYYNEDIWWPLSTSYSSHSCKNYLFKYKRPRKAKWRNFLPEFPFSFGRRFVFLILILLFALSTALIIIVLALITHNQAIIDTKLKNTLEPYERLLQNNKEEQCKISRQMMSEFNGTEIRQNLHWIAHKMHIAGTDEQLELVDKLAQKYREMEFEVRTYDYPEVLLSVPNFERPNKVHSWNERHLRWELISDGIGRPPKSVKTHPELNMQLSDDPRLLYWWNAFSENGTAIGQLVYANYGTVEDFELLEKWNISMEGKIVLIRYGSIFRGEKIRLAEERGAVGAILFADPFDYVPGNKTFPDDLWMPALASQRGTIYRGTGDPEGVLPRIVVTSIGYANAHKLLHRMDGPIVPWSRWSGALPVPYRLTGSLLVRLDVWTRTDHRPIRNFVALMRGREEPDRWVMVGNHADAWTKGSIDPGTGTSTMMEMARVLSKYSAMTGWKPRRTIAFCQWDAEEFGLIGSTEWVEQNLRLIQKRAIAYVNVDNLNGNNSLIVKSVPLLYRLIAEAASKVEQPVKSELRSGRNTLLDSWQFHNPRPTLPGDRSVPHILPPHSGSDFQPFIAFAGVPVADLRMESAPQYSYMLYHTAYEVPWLNDNFVDPEGNASVAMGQLWLEIARNLADNMIIPFNVEDYGIALKEFCTKANTQMRMIGIDSAMDVQSYNERMDFLNDSIRRFQEKAVKFQRLIHAINSGDRRVPLLRREQLNQRLQSLEQCFVLDNGISADRLAFRHAIFSAPEEASNAGMLLPILLDPSFKWLSAQRRANRTEANHRMDQLKMGFSLLQFCVECASEALTIDQ